MPPFTGKERRSHPDQCLMQEEWGRVLSHIEGTEEYRRLLCEKIENVRREERERFEILIAQIRSDKADRDAGIELVNKRVSSIKSTAGGIMFWGVCSLVTFATAWGALTTVVMTNTHKWEVLEPEHRALIKDVEVLKEKSYGYRGIAIPAKV